MDFKRINRSDIVGFKKSKTAIVEALKTRAMWEKKYFSQKVFSINREKHSLWKTSLWETGDKSLLSLLRKKNNIIVSGSFIEKKFYSHAVYISTFHLAKRLVKIVW